MMKYLEEVPETVVGVKLGRRPELNWLSLPSPLTKNIVFLFFLKPAHGGNSRNQASDYLPYQQAHHDGLALRTTNLGVGSRKFRATRFWYRQLIGNKLQNTPAKYLIGVLRTLCY